ncbi:tetratricopeptide repeat protein 17 isoform X4 [Athene noctua]|uniref:tetratricopeptide repeat protein 17 isoform X4 n=1 Tax=Athene noctua TaxID=126797 RepID=UPI003EB903EF
MAAAGAPGRGGLGWVWVFSGWALGLCSLLASGTRPAAATTHWVVTEDGKIQQQVDSPMNLRNPHDLVILMRQETTVNYLKELEKQLVAQKIHIEENEDRDTGLEQRHNKEDPDCIKAKVPLGDLDLYDGTYITLESKDIRPEDYIDTKSPVPPDLQQPDCTKVLDLPYSIHAFQHLRGVQERVNLSAPLLPKEDPIFTYLSRRLGRSIEEIGHRIYDGLMKNSSSWVLYNMASFYWRIKNEPYQVVECAMRALHFSSRQNKDIALVNLANILHRAHFSADAAIVVHAALDYSDFFTSYYTLGNIYAFGEDSSTSSMTSVNLDLHSNQSDHSQSLQSSPVARSIVSVWSVESNRDKQHILWPQRSECMKSFPKIPDPEELPTYFLPPENRGFRIQPILSIPRDTVGHGETQAPDCSSITDARNNESLNILVKELDSNLDLKFKMPDDQARQVLHSRINNQTVTQAKIEAFLDHAMRKPEDPLWLVLNEAGLYWRAVGNSTFAITCLQKAFNLAPHEYQDIPLVNLANLLIHYGLHLDASRLLLKALAINASEPLTFLSLGNAYLALNNISGALQAFRHALDLTTKCLECESSLKMIRCLQFYPFLYNITSSVCSDTVTAESNGSEGVEGLEDNQMSEEMLALVDEFENSWPQEAFEGALEVKGRRMDLQGIRVLKKGSQDGLATSCFGDCGDDDEAEWITFQVKRLKKPKAESLDLQEPVGRNGEEGTNGENENFYQTALEISGPKIPSPGPIGKRRDYRSLGWPSPDECLKLRRVELTTVASTWLAVSAKNIDITEHIDFATQLQEPAMEPLCNPNLPASMHTLDHLQGVSSRASLHYTGESQLKEVLQNLGKDQYSPQSLEQVGTRIAKALEKNQTSWVLSSMAALYWRVKGQGKKAIDCLRQALHYAPHHMKDVPLISLANIFHNAKLWNDAIIVATMAVEIAPHFVVNHFTLANVYVAMEEFEKAMKWYESTLKLQPEFAPAKNRIRTIQCHLLMKKERRSP